MVIKLLRLSRVLPPSHSDRDTRKPPGGKKFGCLKKKKKRKKNVTVAEMEHIKKK